MNIQSVQPFNATSPQTVQQGMQQSPLSPQMQAQAMNAIFNQAPNQINQAMQMQQQQQPQMPWSQYLPPL